MISFNRFIILKFVKTCLYMQSPVHIFKNVLYINSFFYFRNVEITFINEPKNLHYRIRIFIIYFAQVNNKIQYFPLRDVKLSESVFNKAMKADKNYMMSMEPDRLLAPYLREAGLPPKAENYPNWENTGLDGHIGGHYISALSLMYASTGDPKVKQRLDYMIDELDRCQQSSVNGYLSGVPSGKNLERNFGGNIRASGFD